MLLFLGWCGAPSWRELSCALSSYADELEKVGLPPRHLQAGCNVPMFRTSIANSRAGVFGGDLVFRLQRQATCAHAPRQVVSMRPYAVNDVTAVSALTSKYPGAHGAPVHVGKYGGRVAVVAYADVGDLARAKSVSTTLSGRTLVMRLK